MLVVPLISPPHKGPYRCCCFIPLYNNILAAVTHTQMQMSYRVMILKKKKYKKKKMR